MSADTPAGPLSVPTSKSLLSKYKIPINHLSFEYIGGCSDAKELERIVRVLRSGEEGVFPNLQKVAEDQLRHFSPNNRHLRESGLTGPQSVDKEELEHVLKDILVWKEEITERDMRLNEIQDSPVDETSLVPIRTMASQSSAVNESVKSSSHVKRIRDYVSWDKYDVETELLKMDLEEEPRKESERQGSKELKQDILSNIAKEACKLTEYERRILAEQKIDRGNEYYRAKDFEEAVKCYTASIAIWPTARARNNRAACCLAQGKYSQVLEDTNIVLDLEPGNMKALYRRNIAREKKNSCREPLDGLKEQPTKMDARHFAEHVTPPSLMELCEEPQPTRLKIVEVE